MPQMFETLPHLWYITYMEQTTNKGASNMEEIQGQIKAVWNDGEGSHGHVIRNHYGISDDGRGRKIFRIQAKYLLVGDTVAVTTDGFVGGAQWIKITKIEKEEMEFTDYSDEDNPVTVLVQQIKINDSTSFSENKFVNIFAIKNVGKK
jgi:hypothetical protein